MALESLMPGRKRQYIPSGEAARWWPGRHEVVLGWPVSTMDGTARCSVAERRANGRR